MADAIYLDVENERIEVAASTIAAGQIVQLADGRAAVYQGAKSAVAGESAAYKTDGLYTVKKPSGVVFLDGCELHWDHSANAAILRPAAGGSDKDFYLGTCKGDAASSATTCEVYLNVRPRYIIDLTRDAFAHVPVLTAGAPITRMIGGAARSSFSLTAEAQKLDLLSRRSFPLDSGWILDAVVNVAVNADADVADLNVGVANGTHASDADSITQAAFFHLDMGADLNIYALSRDGTTTVGATDTTEDWAVGTPRRLTLDGRDPANVKYYVDGVEVLAATENLGNIAAATGPLYALFHLEKSSNDSPGEVELLEFTVRTSGNE